MRVVFFEPSYPPHLRIPNARSPSSLPPPTSLHVAVSRRRYNKGHVPADSPLELLPLELRDHILSLLDLQQLRGLVHASPVFHAYYRRFRMSLLTGALETSLRDGTIDSAVMPVIDERGWSVSRCTKGILYDEWRNKALTALRDGHYNRIEIIDTATFFLYFVTPTLRTYEAYRSLTESDGDKPSSGLGRENRQVAELSIQARKKLDDCGTYLHTFYCALNVWRTYLGLGFMKKALKRDEYLHLKPDIPSGSPGTMVFDYE